MNIESIIKQRLDLQSTQKALWNDFSASHDVNILKSHSFLSRYQKWPQEQKNKFIIILGGKANFNKTKEFLENK